MKTRVEIATDVLLWAKDRAGLDGDALTRAFPHFVDWLRGDEQPTIKQAEKLAKKAHVPLGYLLLPEPPEEPVPIADFRTKGDRGIAGRPSPSLLDTLHQMMYRQDWMRGYLRECGSPELPFVGSVSIDDDICHVASIMRHVFGLDQNWAAHKKWNDALITLLDRCENIGIHFCINGVVENNTHRALNPDEFRGFVLIDKHAPLIFINGADAKSAQMFTLAHELAHVWVGQSSLFDIPELEDRSGSRIEEFCNQVAAEFLVPSDLIRSYWPSVSSASAPFDELAKVFKVSPLAIARRAYGLGLVGHARYYRFYRDRMTIERAKPENPGGNFYATQRYRLGRPFASAVIRSAQRGDLLFRDACRLLSFSDISTFDKFVAQCDEELL